MTKAKSLSTQCDRVLEYMKTHDGITQMDALNEIGVWRLASRISDLRRIGYIISKSMVSVKNRYGEKCRIAKYRLES